MRPKITPPPGCDLSLTSRKLAEIYGISAATAYRWKRDAGIQMRPGPRGISERNVKLWGHLSARDWKQGYARIGRVMGVSPQAVCQMRRRLLAAGHNIPGLKWGQRP